MDELCLVVKKRGLGLVMNSLCDSCLLVVDVARKNVLVNMMTDEIREEDGLYVGLWQGREV